MADEMKYIEYLTEEIGVRPANTEEEYYAASEIEKTMKEHGVETIVQDVQVPGFAQISYAICYITTALTAIISGFHPIACVVMFLLSVLSFGLFFMERVDNGVLSKLGPTGRSQNVIARHKAEKTDSTRKVRPIIILANYDSPKASLLWSPALAQFQGLFYKVSTVCMAAIPVLNLFHMIAILPGTLLGIIWFLSIVAALPLLVFGINILISHFGLGYVKGANDNASGVAALLGILDRSDPLGVKPLSSGDEKIQLEGGAEVSLDDIKQVAQEMTLEEERKAKTEGREPKSFIDTKQEAPKKEKPMLRRGAGVAKAAGILPEGVEIIYSDLDADLGTKKPEAKEAVEQVTQNEQESVEDQTEEAHALAEKLQSEELEAEKERIAKENKRNADKSLAHQAPAKPSLPRDEHGNVQVRSRFADLPILKEEAEEDEAPEAVDNAAERPVVSDKKPQLSVVKPAPEKKEEAEEKKIQSAADVEPAPEFNFEVEDIKTAVPSYDAEKAVEEAKREGKINDEPVRFEPAPSKVQQIETLGLEHTRNEVGDITKEKDTPSAQDIIDEDPMWGKTTYTPNKNVKVMDLPNPADTEADPFSASNVTPIGDFNPEDFPADEFATGTFKRPGKKRQEEFPEIEMPKENVFQRIGDKFEGFFNKKRKKEEESFSDWLDLDEDFDAKKDGRKIGSWDNFKDDDPNDSSWRGGGTKGYSEEELEQMKAQDEESENIQAVEKRDLSDEDIQEIRDYILSMNDSQFTAHEIWFVATGASSMNNSGARQFFEEYGKELKGALVINLKGVGAGDLAVYTKEGAGQTRNGDRRLSNIIKKVGKDFHRPILGQDMSWLNTDATVAMRNGFRAITLSGVENGVPIATSWDGDTIDIIDPDQLHDAIEIVIETIRRS